MVDLDITKNEEYKIILNENAYKVFTDNMISVINSSEKMKADFGPYRTKCKADKKAVQFFLFAILCEATKNEQRCEKYLQIEKDDNYLKKLSKYYTAVRDKAPYYSLTKYYKTITDLYLMDRSFDNDGFKDPYWYEMALFMQKKYKCFNSFNNLDRFAYIAQNKEGISQRLYRRNLKDLITYYCIFHEMNEEELVSFYDKIMTEIYNDPRGRGDSQTIYTQSFLWKKDGENDTEFVKDEKAFLECIKGSLFHLQYKLSDYHELTDNILSLISSCPEMKNDFETFRKAYRTDVKSVRYFLNNAYFDTIGYKDTDKAGYIFENINFCPDLQQKFEAFHNIFKTDKKTMDLFLFGAYLKASKDDAYLAPEQGTAYAKLNDFHKSLEEKFDGAFEKMNRGFNRGKFVNSDWYRLALHLQDKYGCFRSFEKLDRLTYLAQNDSGMPQRLYQKDLVDLVTYYGVINKKDVKELEAFYAQLKGKIISCNPNNARGKDSDNYALETTKDELTSNLDFMKSDAAFTDFILKNRPYKRTEETKDFFGGCNPLKYDTHFAQSSLIKGIYENIFWLKKHGMPLEKEDEYDDMEDDEETEDISSSDRAYEIAKFFNQHLFSQFNHFYKTADDLVKDGKKKERPLYYESLYEVLNEKDVLKINGFLDADKPERMLSEKLSARNDPKYEKEQCYKDNKNTPLDIRARDFLILSKMMYCRELNALAKFKKSMSSDDVINSINEQLLDCGSTPLDPVRKITSNSGRNTGDFKRESIVKVPFDMVCLYYVNTCSNDSSGMEGIYSYLHALKEEVDEAFCKKKNESEEKKSR